MFDEIQGGRSRVRSPTAKRGEAGGAQAAQLSGSLENPLARPLIAAPILLPTPRSIVGRYAKHALGILSASIEPGVYGAMEHVLQP